MKLDNEMKEDMNIKYQLTHEKKYQRELDDLKNSTSR